TGFQQRPRRQDNPHAFGAAPFVKGELHSALVSPFDEAGEQTSSTNIARLLHRHAGFDPTLPVFQLRSGDAFGALPERYHLFRGIWLELLCNANVILKLTDGGAADG